MELNKNIEELAIKFIYGELDQKEEIQFLNKIESDPELKEYIRLQKEIDAVLTEDSWSATEFDANNPKARTYLTYFTDEENRRFYEKLKSLSVTNTNVDDFMVDQTESDTRKISRPKTLKWIGAVAAVLAIALLGWQFLGSSEWSSDELYAKYSAYENLPGMTDKNGENVLAEAEIAFKQGNYELAEEKLSSYHFNPEDGFSDIATIYRALSVAEIGRLEEALAIIAPVAEDDNSLRREDAQYYLALLLLKKNDIERSQALLNAIANDAGHKRATQARELLRRME